MRQTVVAACSASRTSPIRTSAAFAGRRAARGDLVGKRAVGYVNLVVNRMRKHKMELLEALRVDLRAQAPDHLALTGDLSNIVARRRVARGAGLAGPAGVAPDAITRHPRQPRRLRARGAWRRASSSGCSRPTRRSDLDRRGRMPRAPDYPFVQIREPLALIGVSSCVATGDSRRLGTRSARRSSRGWRRCSSAPELAAQTRVVLMHHPPVRPQGRQSTATCATATRFAAVLGARRRRAGPARPRPPGRARRAAGPGRREPSRSSAPARRRTRAARSAGPATTSTSSRAGRSPGSAASTTRRPASSAKPAASDSPFSRTSEPWPPRRAPSPGRGLPVAQTSSCSYGVFARWKRRVDRNSEIGVWSEPRKCKLAVEMTDGRDQAGPWLPRRARGASRRSCAARASGT